MTANVDGSKTRTEAQIREHYEIEKRLATRLRNSSKQERQTLYSEVYDELFLRVDHHPLVAQKQDKTRRNQEIRDSIRFLSRFLNPTSTFLEVGPGDCALAFAVADMAEKVYAVDVSVEIMSRTGCPENCHLLLSTGCDIPVPPESVDVAYSKDLMEHLHPDDALEQLRNIFDALKPGGVYICRTPNAISGPHDISRFFSDRIPAGLHLKEYTTTELAKLFRSVGFRRVTPYVWGKGRLLKLPLWPVVAAEKVLMRMPGTTGRNIARRLPLKRVLSRVIATK